MIVFLYILDDVIKIIFVKIKIFYFIYKIKNYFNKIKSNYFSIMYRFLKCISLQRDKIILIFVNICAKISMDVNYLHCFTNE